MTQEIAEHLRKMTSRNGRYWLRDTRQLEETQANEELPFQSVGAKRPHFASKSAMHESVVVSIPDVAAVTAQAAKPVVDRKVDRSKQPKVGTTSAGMQTPASQTTLPEIPTPVSPPHDPPNTRVKISVPPLAPVVPKQPPFRLPDVAAPVESAEKEAAESRDASDAARQSKSLNFAKAVASEDEAVKASRANQTPESDDSITKIADEILDCFPAASPSVIMFAGSQSSFHTDETCARVAAELASRQMGRVLLIDSDFEGRRLTVASGMSKQGGLSEVMNIAYPWREAILKSGSSKLDFMPAGSCPHKRWTPKKTLREALAEIRNGYQFVCICVGDAHNSAASTWAELSDGALMVVSAAQSSDAVAVSAVNELRDQGARMLGCVVADIDG